MTSSVVNPVGWPEGVPPLGFLSVDWSYAVETVTVRAVGLAQVRAGGHQIDDGLHKPAGTQSVTTAATPHSNWMSRCSYDVVGTRPVGTCHSYRRPLLVMRRPSLNTTRPSSPASLAAIGTASPAVP